MEFITEAVDKKTIQKQNIGINQFFIENNLSQIEQIIQFLKSQSKLLLINGFMGTGKILAVNQALSFLNDNVVTLRYNCFETTILDDILLEFFDSFKKLTAQNVIKIPKARPENFTQKINAYFDSIEQPVVIIINSFEQILKESKQEILNFLQHISKLDNIKIILISRKFDYKDFSLAYDKVSINDYFYTTLSIKIMQQRKLNLMEFLSGYTKSFLSFNDFILREALSLVDPVSGHLFRFLTIMRHPVNVKLLQQLNLYDADKLAFFVDNLLLTREGSLIYLQDYYKEISENSIADNIAVKIHKSCAELYKTQLPLKPLERDLLISRQTMRREIEYHSLFIPKKPVLTQKPVTELQFIEQQIQQNIPQTKAQKDEQIKKISFIFDSPEDENLIMNKIASSINRFVDISDKNAKDYEEIEKLPLIELINLAKKEEANFDYKKVIMIYQKALTMNNDDDYYTFLPTIYTKLAQNFNKLSDWFNSLKYYELAEEFYVSTGDIEKINDCKYEIANIYYITFKREKAEKILKEIISENISKNLKIKSELLLASITGESIKALLPEDTRGIEKNILAELYFKCALNYDEEGNIDNAVKFYKKCVETSQDPEINAYLSSSLTNLATIYDEDGKSDMAAKYLQESLRLDELTKNYNGIYISSMKLAQINSFRMPQKSLEYLKKAKACALELNETFYIASSDVALGDYYYNQKDYKNALNYYKNAHKLALNNFTHDNINKIEVRINDIQKLGLQ